jgi:hypothetical protein
MRWTKSRELMDDGDSVRFVGSLDRYANEMAHSPRTSHSLLPGLLRCAAARSRRDRIFGRTFGRLALGFNGHVAIIHGDRHTLRVDQPVRDSQGRTMTNITRAETYGNPTFHALIMTVYPGSRSMFMFEPLVVRQNAVR